MRSLGFTIACVALAASGCGGRQSMASKSAAAYAEAQRKGIPVTADEHGGHHEETPPSDAPAMPGMDHSTMTGMDHGEMSHDEHAGHAAMPGMDHAQMQHGSMQHDMPNMQHDMPNMQHDMPGMSHAQHQHGAAPNPNVTVDTAAPRASSAAVDPASTLKPDDFDAPKTPQQASAKSTETDYTCPMHPQIHSATPGKCPICGMTLVKKEQ